LNPGIRLEIFYHFAKCLWQLGHGQEAVTVLTALCVSDEAGRVDDPRVALCIPRILSRTAQWAGELRLETVDEIRQNYIEKAISLSLRNHDLKSVVKSKIRFVKVIDPVVANDGSLKNLVCEEFGFLTDIVSSGVVVDSKSAWFASRLVSLWFNHPAVTSPLIGRCRSALATSRSLLPFFYQIASRLGDTGPEFKKELLLLVLETTRNHPSICLPPILQLRQVSGGLGSKSVVVAKLEQERSKQAEYVIEKLKSIPETKVVIESMIAAFKFYFNLAMLKVVAMEPVIGSSTRPNCGNRPRRLVSEVDGYRDYAAAIRAGNATVLTCDGCVVDSIQPEFSIADSGKSLPKILTLVDAQGRLHKQIVKGNDDLRNDAVLQQLFSLVDSATSASMRSYKVVPITACAGIAEWVANTTTIGSYLVGYPDESTGAHARYFPSDLAASTVKAKMVHARQQNAKKELESALLNTYKSCCSKFSPSMKYVFHEHFASPKDWYFAQSKFSSSVAATSIVGFIVGLGDRHPNNILIDTKTGEVVHIDYGICFDAGRLLKIPEIVPFRLTRDMVDGLGSLGTQGPFSKTCEDLLLALKKNSALVTAVVEVFVVDPLFNWAVASLGSDNAQVALDGVKKKLQGFLEATDVIPLTPAAQVDRLIRAATDPRNLSLMFAGWQPWL
jgi:ataxia telangiectasia mutated family protein